MIKIDFNDFYDYLLNLCDKLSHRVDEQHETIDELLHKIEKQKQKIDDMQKEIERLHKVFDIKDEARCKLIKENKELQRIIANLQSDLVESKNDYKQSVNEIKLLNNQMDMLQRNVGYLCEENRKLRDTINAYEQLF